MKLCFCKAGLISLDFALVLLPPVCLSVPTDSQKQPYSGSSAVFADELKRLLLNFLWIFSAAFATVHLSFSEKIAPVSFTGTRPLSLSCCFWRCIVLLRATSVFSSFPSLAHFSFRAFSLSALINFMVFLLLTCCLFTLAVFLLLTSPSFICGLGLDI